MKIWIINGPNINLTGIREREIYGDRNYHELQRECKKWAKEFNVRIQQFQTNHEGKMIDLIQRAYRKGASGIIINGGGYTHTSIAIMDALKAVPIPTVEVHMSAPSIREEYRHFSFIREASVATFEGQGFESYHHALTFLISKLTGSL